jgi:exonuclease VII large subunit
LSNEYLTKATEAELKDQEITILSEAIDSTLTNLEANVTSQLEETKMAFDNLSTKLEEQSKRAQEQAEKQSQAQLDAFREAIDKVVASNTATTQSGTSGTSGGNTTSGGSSTSGGSGGSNTGGTTGNSSKDGIPPIKEKRLRQQITDAINSPRISLETLEQIALDLDIRVTLPDFVLPKTSTSQRDRDLIAQYNTLVRDAKSAIKAAVDKISPTDDAVLITVWTDLKEAGLIVESDGTTSGSTSTSGTSGTGGSSTGGTGGRGGGGGGTGRNVL